MINCLHSVILICVILVWLFCTAIKSMSTSLFLIAIYTKMIHIHVLTIGSWGQLLAGRVNGYSSGETSWPSPSDDDLPTPPWRTPPYVWLILQCLSRFPNMCHLTSCRWSKSECIAMCGKIFYNLSFFSPYNGLLLDCYAQCIYVYCICVYLFILHFNLNLKEIRL